MDVTTIAFLCFIAGAIIRTVYGFLAKVVTDGVKFNAQYWATFGITVISTVMLAIAAFAALPIPAGVPLLYVILAALSSGYTINDVINRGVSTYQGTKTTETPETSTPPG